jgi:hypothetical protein
MAKVWKRWENRASQELARYFSHDKIQSYKSKVENGGKRAEYSLFIHLRISLYEEYFSHVTSVARHRGRHSRTSNSSGPSKLSRQ